MNTEQFNDKYHEMYADVDRLHSKYRNIVKEQVVQCNKDMIELRDKYKSEYLNAILSAMQNELIRTAMSKGEALEVINVKSDIEIVFREAFNWVINWFKYFKKSGGSDEYWSLMALDMQRLPEEIETLPKPVRKLYINVYDANVEFLETLYKIEHPKDVSAC